MELVKNQCNRKKNKKTNKDKVHYVPKYYPVIIGVKRYNPIKTAPKKCQLKKIKETQPEFTNQFYTLKRTARIQINHFLHYSLIHYDPHLEMHLIEDPITKKARR